MVERGKQRKVKVLGNPVLNGCSQKCQQAFKEKAVRGRRDRMVGSTHLPRLNEQTDGLRVGEGTPPRFYTNTPRGCMGQTWGRDAEGFRRAEPENCLQAQVHPVRGVSSLTPTPNNSVWV